MAILTERKTWRRPRAPNAPSRSGLTTREQENVLAAIEVLCRRHGTTDKIAAAMGVSGTSVRVMLGRKRVSGGMAIHVARAAGASLETILAGSWPPPGCCRHCGHAIDND